MESEKDNGWKLYFNNNAADYELEVFTRNTLQEVDFIEEEIGKNRDLTILDIGCGTGRHSLEFARRGYRVTGIDLSPEMLKEAISKANRESLTNVEFVEADARSFQLEKNFDLALCLCEGAFGLLSEEDNPFERDLRILKNVNMHLKPGSKLIMTVLNALRTIRTYSDEDVRKGTFDNLSLMEINPVQNFDQRLAGDIIIKEKGFVASELYLMLQISGFKVLNFWGGTAGNWDRKALRMDEMEIMIIAEKL